MPSDPPGRQQGPQPQQNGKPLPFRPVCPYCLTTAPPITALKVSTRGWLVFIFLVLTCVGSVIAWIGLLMKENYKVCSQCGAKLG